jgi:5-methylcytosine-specific restriction endonuclease McrA
MPRMEYVEIGQDGRAIRIFRNFKLACGALSYPSRIAHMLRATAVEDIRRQVWERDNKRCTHCGNMVSFENMQMHERQWRGRGGEISIDNSTTLCSDCHQNSDVAGHGKRRVRFGESS